MTLHVFADGEQLEDVTNRFLSAEVEHFEICNVTACVC